MKVLGFESSCDETGVALVETVPGGVPRLLAEALYSQVDMHAADMHGDDSFRLDVPQVQLHGFQRQQVDGHGVVAKRIQHQPERLLVGQVSLNIVHLEIDNRVGCHTLSRYPNLLQLPAYFQIGNAHCPESSSGHHAAMIQPQLAGSTL